MRPMFIRYDAIDNLYINFDVAKRHYMTGDQDWFLERFEHQGGLQESRFEFDDFVLSCGDGEATGRDYDRTDAFNVRILYKAMMDLPMAVASDERFWCGLSHTYCWDYIQYRRRKELASGDDKKIKTSFFYTYGARRSSYVHCISRLWWAGKLTYDESNKVDPFALTDVLTSSSVPSRILLFSQNITANKNAALGILDAIKEQSDSGVELKREHFVGATKYLNRMSAITLLDCLDRQRIREMISDYFSTEEFANLKV